MKLDKILYIAINIIFLLLTFLTMQTDTVIIDIILPLTIIILSIIWKPYTLILPFILASNIKVSTIFNSILLTIICFVLYSVFFIKTIKDVRKEIEYIACNSYRTIFLLNDGTVKGCEMNGNGQLGIGNNTQQNVVWIGVLIYIYISTAYIDYVPAIIKGLQTLL